MLANCIFASTPLIVTLYFTHENVFILVPLIFPFEVNLVYSFFAQSCCFVFILQLRVKT